MENIYLPLHIVTWDEKTRKPHVAPGRRSDGTWRLTPHSDRVALYAFVR